MSLVGVMVCLGERGLLSVFVGVLVEVEVEVGERLVKLVRLVRCLADWHRIDSLKGVALPQFSLA